jgi:hypothetical protein
VPRQPAHFHIESRRDFGSVISGKIVDDDYFIIGGDLREQGAEASRKSRSGVASGYDHREPCGQRLIESSHIDAGDGHYFWNVAPDSRTSGIAS